MARSKSKSADTHLSGDRGWLSVVATPIGNLEDISQRGARTLAEVDLIACEDTRVTSKLFAGQRSKPLMSLHHHSSEAKMRELIDAMLSGKRIAYVSDAGTPGVNDPGGKLVAAAYAAGIRVEPIPGPSALTAAISVCGFPMERFRYVGFLPHKKGRETLFRELAEQDEPTVFLESTHRIGKAMDELVRYLDPSRLIYVGRELTKKFETNLRGTAEQVRAQLTSGVTKGEFIVVVGPRGKGAGETHAS